MKLNGKEITEQEAIILISKRYGVFAQGEYIRLYGGAIKSLSVDGGILTLD